MATSSVQKLLSNEAYCLELSSLKVTVGTVSWETAKDQAAAYRKHINDLPIKPAQKVSSYVLTEEDIKILLAQDTGKIKAMRIYLGHEKIPNIDPSKPDCLVVKLYIVGCELNSNSKEYDDFNLADELNPNDPPNTLLSEVRPCPTNCGSRNFMNQP